MRYVHNVFMQTMSYAAANFRSRKNGLRLKSKSVKQSITNDALS